MDTSDSRRVAWLQQMVEIRLFEQKTQELSTRGVIGSTHLGEGQEAVSVGAIAALASHDNLTYTYRSHAPVLARGMTMEACFAEMMGRRTGCCGGVGGTMHLADFSLGLLGAFAIVGAGMPVAVGAALSAKLQGTSAVTMTFCGDGATNIGSFHEAVNMAAVWKAPVVFVVENNLYGEYSPVLETTPAEDLARRAEPYGIPGVIVDGQDVELVFSVAAEAAARARAGDGPTMIEAKTYRYRGHASRDPGKYRPDDEIAYWREKDPTKVLGTRLIEANVLSESDVEQIWKDAEARVNEAAEQAAAAEFPTIEEIEPYVYAH